MPEVIDNGPLDDETVDLDVLDRELLLEGHIFSVVRESFAYNDVELSREFVAHPGAVAVVAVDDDDRVLLIKQYRHPIRSRDWEIPAGLLDVTGEPMLAAAQRELAEEADIEAREWSVLLDLVTSPGGSNEFVRVYLARGLAATASAFDREGEEADLELRWVAVDEVVEAIMRGTVRNAILVAGVLAARVARSAEWSRLRDAEPSEL